MGVATFARMHELRRAARRMRTVTDVVEAMATPPVVAAPAPTPPVAAPQEIDDEALEAATAPHPRRTLQPRR